MAEDPKDSGTRIGGVVLPEGWTNYFYTPSGQIVRQKDLAAPVPKEYTPVDSFLNQRTGRRVKRVDPRQPVPNYFTPIDIGRIRKDAVRPAPIMQAALEGGAIGGVTGGLAAIPRIAAETAAGAKLQQLSEPVIQKVFPGDSKKAAVARFLASQIPMLVPGIAAETVAAKLRARPGVPGAEVQPGPEVEVREPEGAPAPAAAPESPELAVAGELQPTTSRTEIPLTEAAARTVRGAPVAEGVELSPTSKTLEAAKQTAVKGSAAPELLVPTEQREMAAAALRGEARELGVADVIDQMAAARKPISAIARAVEERIGRHMPQGWTATDLVETYMRKRGMARLSEPASLREQASVEAPEVPAPRVQQAPPTAAEVKAEAPPPVEAPVAAVEPPQAAAAEETTSTPPKKGKGKKKAEPEQRESLLPEVEAQQPQEGEPPPNPDSDVLDLYPVGRNTDAWGPSGKKYGFRYRVAGLSKLTIHHPDVQTPERASAGEQGRASSEARAREIAATLDSGQFFAGEGTLDKGAPIIGPDGIVESGNHRIQALGIARSRNAEGLQRFIEDQRARAEEFGLSPEEIDEILRDGDIPVIVRERVTPVDRKAFALEANGAGSMRPTATEEALADAYRLPSGAIMDLQIPDSARNLGEVLQAGANQKAMQAFMASVPSAERAPLVDAKAEFLTPAGVTRFRNAMLARVFGGESGTRLVRTFAESEDHNIRNIETGIVSSLGKLAKLKELISNGERPDVDISHDLSVAASKLSALRQQGVPVEDYIRQFQLGGGRDLTPTQERLLQALGEMKSAKQVREFLGRYTDEALKLPNPQQIEEATAIPSVDELIEDARSGGQQGFGFAKPAETKPEWQPDVVAQQQGAAAAPEAESPVQAELGSGSHALFRKARGAGGEEAPPPPRPPAEPPAERPAPASQEPAAPVEAPAQQEDLEELTDYLKQQPEGEKPQTRLDRASRRAAAISGVKDGVNYRYGQLQAAAAWMRSLYSDPPKWNSFLELLGKFDGALQQNSIRLRRFAQEVKRVVPDKLRREAMTNWIQANGDVGLLAERAAKSHGRLKLGYELAQELTPREMQYAAQMRRYFDQRMQTAIDAGLFEQGVDDYVTQIWGDTPNDFTQRLRGDFRRRALQSGDLRPNPDLAKQRVFNSYFEGEQAGFVPKDKDIGYLLSAYDQSFNKAMASRGMIRAMLARDLTPGKPILAPVNDPVHPEYIPLDHPAFRHWEGGALAAHPDIVKHLSHAFSRSWMRDYAVTRGLLKGSFLAKDLRLAYSFFHPVQIGLHAAFHKVNPFTTRPLDLNDPFQSAMIEHGLQVGGYHGLQDFTEGLHAGGLAAKVPIIGPWHQRLGEWLFQDYIPRLKMNLAQHAYERNMIRYGHKWTPDQIMRYTADQVNAAFGELNYRMMGRSRTAQDVFRMFAFAPDFLEARLKFVGQALREAKDLPAETISALKRGQLVKPGEQLSALVRGGLAMYFAARVLNKVLDGDYHTDRPFSLVLNGREYNLRSIQGDIFHAWDDPRSFVYHRINPATFRPAMEMAMGRDAYGRQRDFSEQLRDLVPFPIPIESLWTGRDRKLWEDMLQGFGVAEFKYRSPAQRYAGEALGRRMGDLTPAEQRQYEDRRKLREQLRSGEASAGDVWRQVRSGKYSQEQGQRILRDAKRADLERQARQLSTAQLLEMWPQTTDAEKKMLRPIMVGRLSREMSRDVRRQLVAAIRSGGDEPKPKTN